VVFVDPIDNVVFVCELMSKRKASAVLVVEDNTLLGIITERDM
jgi:CBS domain-containing protein